jgi:hypothetical protein
MIAYLIKMILCSGLLLAAYFLLLEKEKMHRFNRFYLLFSIVFSFIIPLISININVEPIQVIDNSLYETFDENPAFDVNTVPYTNNRIQKEINVLPLALLILYCLVTAFLIYRFAGSVYRLFTKACRGKGIRYRNAKLILTNDKTATHTFLNTIFISNSDYNGQHVEEEVLIHELTHVRQRHSLDILFIEMVKSIVWFNPFFILYKRAIQLNHEFLADDAVINTHKNISAYQHLLLDKISQLSSSYLSSSLNFLITKKRLAMMKQMKNNRRAIFKITIAVTLLAGAFFLFSEKVYAQVKKDSVPTQRMPPEVLKDSDKTQHVSKSGPKASNETHPPKVGRATGKVHGSGVSEELLNEYETGVKSAYKKTTAPNGMMYYRIDITGLDIKKLRSIYNEMTEEQQSQATCILGYIPLLPPPAKKSPPADLLKTWEDAAMYGIWIDGKRISNTDLAKHEPSDFAYYVSSKLYGKAYTGKHHYQIDLMTHAYYKKSYIDNREQ